MSILRSTPYQELQSAEKPKPSKSRNLLPRLPEGWRKTAVILTTVIILLSTFLLIALLVSIFRLGGSLSEESLLFEGHCDTSAKVDTALHLLINVIASGVLASSNFFMQILCAPTREEVDRAHQKRRYLEIGVQSWRNIWNVSSIKAICWVCLALSSLPIHLFFNSSVSQVKASTDAIVIVATSDFVQGGPYRLDKEATSTSSFFLNTTSTQEEKVGEIASEAEGWNHEDPGSCFDKYNGTDVVLTEYRNLVIIVSDANDSSADTSPAAGENPDNSSSLWLFFQLRRTDRFQMDRAEAMRMAPSQIDFVDSQNRLDSFAEIRLRGVDGSWEYHPSNDRLGRGDAAMEVEYCLSEPFQSSCKVQTNNLVLLVVVCACLAKTALCAAVTVVLGSRRPPLVTLGDAIASFITHPDPTTEDRCTMDRCSFSTKKSPCKDGNGEWPHSPRYWTTRASKKQHWAHAVPLSIWLFSYSLICTAMGVMVYFFQSALQSQSVEGSYFGHSAKNAQIGVYLLYEEADDRVLVLIANTPQVIFSLCYLVYNGLWTRVMAEVEWSKYSVDYTTLRVTNPQGKQRSTYRLQLPFRVSIPLIVASILLHWLISQSLYVTTYEGNKHLYDDSDQRDMVLHFSTVSILITLILSVTLALLPLGTRFLRLPGNTVLAGSCSAVMSAACHCILDTTEAHIKCIEESSRSSLDSASMDQHASFNTLEGKAQSELKWGVVTQPQAGHPGHLAFGSLDEEVTAPIHGEKYQGSGKLVT